MIEYMDSSDSRYQPGVCNIGPAEVQRRRRVGWFGVAATIAAGALLLLLDAPAVMRLLVAIPAAAAFSGFIQAHLRFCAGFASAGLQNLGELGQEQRIEDAGARAADRRKALTIYAASVAGGVAVAVAFTLLPI
jgi:hypothetical protein